MSEQLQDSKREFGAEHEDDRGVYYVTEGGQVYHYEWCHDCGGDGCDYCDGVGQVRVDGR